MAGYRSIVVGVDFSKNSRVAAIRAAALAGRDGATLTLLNVVEHFPEDIPVNPIPPENIDPATFYMERAKAELAELARELGTQAAEQEVLISSKSANHEILEWAGQHPVDLLVVGAHDRDAKAPLGSTAMAISNHAPCDVLIVHAEK
ncbi:MAG TPA: universal stress protein [Gammaproteobacteria bacterium]|nr:universal stress protein [Gammaproteobacteria bacterium]